MENQTFTVWLQDLFGRLNPMKEAVLPAVLGLYTERLPGAR